MVPKPGDKKTAEEKKLKEGDKKGTSTATTKVKTAVNTMTAATAIGGKKGKEADEPDPIEESLNLRIKAGGVT